VNKHKAETPYTKTEKQSGTDSIYEGFWVSRKNKYKHVYVGDKTEKMNKGKIIH
jgi:hypothetical protein